MATNDLHPLACDCTDCDAEAVKPCAYCPADDEDTTIAALRAHASNMYRKASECYARAYEAEAEADRLAGEPLAADFHDALARIHRGDRSPEAEEAKERAYIRLQASRCLDGRFNGIPPEHLDAVRAEVERMRAEQESPGTGTSPATNPGSQ